MLLSTCLLSTPSYSSSLPFSPTRDGAGLVFISGQVALPKERKENKSISFETKSVMDKIQVILKEKNLDFDNVVRATVYLESMEDYHAMNKVYASYFDGQYPTRVAVAVSDLPLGANIEISMIAIK